MAKITIEGMSTFSKQLEKWVAEAHKINRGALGEAAGFVAQQFGQAIDSIPVRDDSTHPHRLYGATASELAQIKDNFGISTFRETSGGTNTSIGFTGYVNTPSKRFNDNVPTGMLVQCINYGTSFRVGTHTLDRVTSASRSEIERIIQEYIEEKTSNIFK